MPRPDALAAALACCLWTSVAVAVAEPLFPNSVVSNDIDFIRSDDPAVPGCMRFVSEATQEMPGALGTDALFADGVLTFAVAFADGSEVGVWVHPAVGSQGDAAAVAGLLVGPLGRLPAVMRGRLSHVVVQAGEHTAFAEHLGRFFVVYEDNLRARIATHDLEETVFHESVHATLEAEWAQSDAWRQAQAADAGFVTDYAAQHPEQEDLPESALFAYAHLRHPGRLPAEVARGVERVMPARLAFFETIFATPEPDLAGAAVPEGCVAAAG